MDRDEKEALLRQKYEAGELDTGLWDIGGEFVVFDIVGDTMSFQWFDQSMMHRWGDGGSRQPDESTCHDQSQYDLSAVIRLTHQKTKRVIEQNGYFVTGFVLTNPAGAKAGAKCVVDMSSVRWFDHPHEVTLSPSLPRDGMQQANEAMEERSENGMKADNQALRKFVDLIGFDPEKVVEELNPSTNNLTGKCLALMGLSTHRDFSASTLSEEGVSAANQWLNTLMKRRSGAEPQ